MSQATLSVAVRARPVSKKERLNGARTITKTVDDKCMVVMDPDDPSSGTDGIPGRHVVKGVHSQKKHVVAGGVRKRDVGMFLTVRLTAKQTMSRFTWARLAH